MGNDRSKKKLMNLIIGLMSTLWIIIVLGGYYTTHKPFTIEILASLGTALYRMAIASLILSLSGGIGAWLLPKRENHAALTRLFLQAALGMNILGLLILIMGMTIGFRWFYFALMLVGLCTFLRKYILNWWRLWPQLKSYLQGGRLVTVLALGTAAILFITLIIALAPPLGFDALTYHLALPRFYLLSNRLSYIAENVFWGMPQQAEMIYTFAMSLAGSEAATTLGWGIGVLTLLGLLGYVAETINNRLGWVAVSCLLGGYSLIASLSAGYAEWFVMLNGLAMFIFLDDWRNSHARENLILAGVFAGFALGSKYTAGFLIPIGLVTILWENFHQPARPTLKNFLLFCISALLPAYPGCSRTCCSLAIPFTRGYIPAGAMTQARLDFFSAPVWGSWLDKLILPWMTTVWGVEGGAGFSWSIGPLLLVFGALAWLGWQRRFPDQKRVLSTATLVTLLGFIVWAVASRWNGMLIQTRLYTAFFPAWAILCGFGFESLSRIKVSGIRFGRIAAAVLLLVVLINLVEIGQRVLRQAPYAVLAGQMTPEAYRRQNLEGYEDAMNAIQNLPPGFACPDAVGDSQPGLPAHLRSRRADRPLV